MVASLKAERVCAAGSLLGESPLWDDETGTVWWLDVHGRRINRTTDGGRLTSTSLDRHISSIAQVQDSVSWLGTGEKGFVELGPGWSREMPVAYEESTPGNAMNDGKCDSRGRMWAGSWSRAADNLPGRLHCLSSDGAVTTLAADFAICNGLGWSPDEKTFYLADTGQRTLFAFDCELDEPRLSNRRALLTVQPGEGILDGLAVDAEGCIWIAMCFAGCVNRYSPDGELIGVVALPVPMVTSVIFGGQDLSTLYITSGTLGDSAIVRARGLDSSAPQPGAGDLYAVDAGVTGSRTYRFQ